MFARRPVAMLSLGAALLSSLIAVCCGLGVFAAPWFMCELFAVQIGSAAGESPRRTAAWYRAGFVQLSAVLVLLVLALLSLLALGPDIMHGGVEPLSTSHQTRLLESLLCTMAAGACTLALTVHFQYAPALLIERGGTLLGALVESAGLVAEGGLLRSWWTSVIAHALPWSAIGCALAAQFAVAGSGRLTLLVLLAALLLIALSIALGQGMIIASYLAQRAAEARPAAVLRASPRLSALSIALVALLVSGPLLVSTALLRPAPIARGELAAGAPVLLDVRPSVAARELYLPDSGLRLVLEPGRLQVVASDGGGAGALPLTKGAFDANPRIARVRVARAFRPGQRSVRELSPGERGFTIEVQLADGRSFATSIDESGVRSDDSLKRRFELLLPRYSALLALLCWAWLALWSARALPRLSLLARSLHEATFERHALLALLWLTPPALLSCLLGAWALLG
jgi:hypothetical protein